MLCAGSFAYAAGKRELIMARLACLLPPQFLAASRHECPQVSSKEESALAAVFSAEEPLPRARNHFCEY